MSRLRRHPWMAFALGLSAGLVAAVGGSGFAQMSGPTEHAGLTVDLLAELSGDTMEATIGLAGYSLRMRAIEIAPGGQIAEHDHADRPGIVTVIDGSWVEGQLSGERSFDAASLGTFPETEETVHWVYNRTDAPATALVCDITKVE